jgi:DNA-binding NtrC family response regulator
VRAKGIENIEKQYLKELLALTNGKIRTASELAGISNRQLHKLMTKYGIRKEDFRLPA